MNFYINDTLIRLSEQVEGSGKELKGRTHASFQNEQELTRLLAEIQDGQYPELEELTCGVKNLQAAWTSLLNFFKLVEAAGGLVRKGEQYLLIHRLGKWDLPKGKLEKGELPEEGALREVEEECMVKVNLDKKICDTWHTYIRNDKRYLKKTHWYSMDLTDDSQMTPQTEEDIEKVEWRDAEGVREAMKDTYPSIKDVFEAYGFR